MKNLKILIAMSLLLFALPFVFCTVSQAQQTIKVADRLAQCEERSRQLEARITELERQLRIGNTGSAMPPTRVPVDSSAQWEITPNPNLKGAMGRLIFRAPHPEQGSFHYEMAIFKSGATERSKFAYFYEELLLPDQYDVTVSNNSEWRLREIPIKRGFDTRIRAGTLYLNLPKTEWKIYNETKQTWVHQGYGVWHVGLPVGKYYVKVNNEFAEVIIRDGEITQF